MNDLPATVLMTADEARACVDAINAHLTGARAELLRLYEGEGWTALGYGSWRECVIAEFGQSKSRVYQLLDAAITEQRISTNVELGTIPEGHLRPLTEFRHEPNLQRETWRAVEQTAPNGHITGRHVQSVVSIVREEMDRGATPEEAVQAVYAAQRLPSPSEANTIARETGLMVVGSDGYYHDGRTKEELASVAARTSLLFRVYEAIEGLAGMSPSPAAFAAMVPEFQRYRIDDHIDAATGWLNTLREVWKG